MEKWRELLASGEPDEIEARLRRHDGVYRWFLIRVEPFRASAASAALLCVGMNAGKRIVPVHNPQSGGHILLEITKDHVQAPAIRALVIPILNEHVERILWTAYVVYRTNQK
jgi:hypothetical protein